MQGKEISLAAIFFVKQNGLAYFKSPWTKLIFRAIIPGRFQLNFAVKYQSTSNFCDHPLSKLDLANTWNCLLIRNYCYFTMLLLRWLNWLPFLGQLGRGAGWQCQVSPGRVAFTGGSGFPAYVSINNASWLLAPGSHRRSHAFHSSIGHPSVLINHGSGLMSCSQICWEWIDATISDAPLMEMGLNSCYTIVAVPIALLQCSQCNVRNTQFQFHENQQLRTNPAVILMHMENIRILS